MKKVLSIALNCILGVFPIQKKKILFQSGRRKIDEHPRIIYQYIKNNFPNKYKLLWIVDKGTDVSELDKEEYCYYRTIKGYIQLATAKYWICSQSLGSIYRKRKGQSYIQLFHGQGALKKMGYDIKGNEGKGPAAFTREWDWLVTTDPLNETVMRSSTGYQGRTLMLGSANTDVLVNFTEEQCKEIKSQVGVDEGKRVILYAPTFRDEDLEELSKASDSEKKEIIKKRIPILKLTELENSVILLRLHPQICQGMSYIDLPGNFIDVCQFSDVQRLLGITDILITDYSSLCITYSVLTRPVIFYTYDYEEYVASRDFYIDYKKELPGPIVYTEQELFDIINTGEIYNEKYKMKNKIFNEKFNSLNDGKVAERFFVHLQNGTFE